MNALTVLPSAQDVSIMEAMAEKLAKSGLLPKAYEAKPAAVFLAIQLGRELGLAPMQSINGINVIQGKPTISPALMSALIMASGKGTYHVKTFSSEKSEIEFTRNGKSTTFVFTMDDAKRAGLAGKDNWKNWPANMLHARNMSNGARLVFPDVIQGLYTPEEIDPDLRVTEGGDVISLPPAAGQAERLDASIEESKNATKEEMDKLHKKDAGESSRAVEGELGGHKKMSDGQKKSLLTASTHKRFSPEEQAAIKLIGETAEITELRAAELLISLRAGKCPEWALLYEPGGGF